MGASCSQLPGSPLGMLKAWAFSLPQHLAGALETLTPTNLCTQPDLCQEAPYPSACRATWPPKEHQ